MTLSPKIIALVTGGAKGIGKAIAIRLANQGGAHVVLVDIDKSAGQASMQEIISNSGSASFIPADIGHSDEICSIISRINEDFGKLDWLVNNAGISSFCPIDLLDVSEFDHVIDVNLRAAFLFSKLAAPLLRQSPCGAIVNISSTRALMSEPGNEAYAASKSGLIGLTHALANSLGPLIRVNAICPGWINVGKQVGALRSIDHSQHPAGRVGLPADIAALTAFLLSPDASFITGQAFVADGGMTKKMIYEE